MLGSLTQSKFIALISLHLNKVEVLCAKCTYRDVLSANLFQELLHVHGLDQNRARFLDRP
jgi:hypothetical protein